MALRKWNARKIKLVALTGPLLLNWVISDVRDAASKGRAVQQALALVFSLAYFCNRQIHFIPGRKNLEKLHMLTFTLNTSKIDNQ